MITQSWPTLDPEKVTVRVGDFRNIEPQIRSMSIKWGGDFTKTECRFDGDRVHSVEFTDKRLANGFAKEIHEWRRVEALNDFTSIWPFVVIDYIDIDKLNRNDIMDTGRTVSESFRQVIFRDRFDWLEKNAVGAYSDPQPNYGGSSSAENFAVGYGFENERDAILFKMFWIGGQA